MEEQENTVFVYISQIGRILLQSTDSNGATLTHLDGRQILTQEGLTTDGRHMIIPSQDSSDSSQGRQILIQPGPSSQGKLHNSAHLDYNLYAYLYILK